MWSIKLFTRWTDQHPVDVVFDCIEIIFIIWCMLFVLEKTNLSCLVWHHLAWWLGLHQLLNKQLYAFHLVYFKDFKVALLSTGHVASWLVIHNLHALTGNWNGLKFHFVVWFDGSFQLYKLVRLDCCLSSLASCVICSFHLNFITSVVGYGGSKVCDSFFLSWSANLTHSFVLIVSKTAFVLLQGSKSIPEELQIFT